MNLDKDINVLSDDELANVSGGMQILTYLPRDAFAPGNIVYFRIVSATEAGPWTRLTEDNLDKISILEPGKYQVQYIIVSDN